MFKKRTVKEQQIININQPKQQTINQAINNNTKQNKPNQQQTIQNIQPKKKVKLDHQPNLISSSTTQNKQKKQAQLHKQFKSLNYSAAQNSLQDKPQNNYSKSQLLLQQQLAKQKYLENVNITKDIKQGKIDTTVYRGINNYANYALTQDQIVNAQQKFRKRQGPSRVNSTIRNTCRFDYNFGLCKDWHDSGYCPFGDSCIYLHDRSNYKTGWQQQRDFQRAQKQRWRRISNPQLAAKQDLQQSLKTIQKFKPNQTCQKCKKQYKSPVQVQCNHVFCSQCAIKMNKCIICKKSLSGIMNNAQKKLIKNKQLYEDLKSKILKEHEQNKIQRKKYSTVDSQNVFAQ